jgi:hypothetical protein
MTATKSEKVPKALEAKFGEIVAITEKQRSMVATAYRGDRQTVGLVGPKPLFPPMQSTLDVSRAELAPARVERLAEHPIDSPFSGD